MESTSFSETCSALSKVLCNLHKSGQRNRGAVLDRNDLGLTEDRKLKIRSGDSSDDLTDISVIGGVEQSPFDVESAVRGLLERILKKIDDNLPKTYDPKAEPGSFMMPTDLYCGNVASAGLQQYEVSSDIALGLRLLREDMSERVHGVLIENGILCVWYR